LTAQNIFLWFFGGNPRENELTQCLTYLFLADADFFNRFLDKSTSIALEKPEIFTQYSIEEGQPDIHIEDKIKKIKIFIEVKAGAGETINENGERQLERYTSHLAKFRKANPDWQTQLILLTDRRFDELPVGCEEILWHEVYSLLKGSTELGAEFMHYLKVIGMADKQPEFGGITQTKVDALISYNELHDEMKDLMCVLESRLKGKMNVKRNFRMTTYGAGLLRLTSKYGHAFVELYLGGSQETFDKLAKAEKGKPYLNIAFSADKQQGDAIAELKKRDFFSYSGCLQKTFSIPTNESKTEQINRILKLIDENVVNL